MNGKISGRLFLSIVVIYITVDLLMGFTTIFDGMSIMARMIVSELIIIVPSLIAFWFSKDRFSDVFALHKIRPVVIPLCILFTLLCMPLCTCLNLFTLFFTSNRAAYIFNELSGGGVVAMAIFSAVAAPVFEELTFRGVIYSGIRKSGSAMQAIVWSALLFGLFHMNINQMFYAAALGAFFGALREVTGSVLPSMICHISVNGGGVLVALLNSASSDGTTELATQAQSVLTTDLMVQALSIYMVMAFAGVGLALCVLALIARKQGGLVRFKEILTQRIATRGRIAGPGLIVAVVLSSLMITFVLVWPWVREAISASS